MIRNAPSSLPEWAATIFTKHGCINSAQATISVVHAFQTLTSSIYRCELTDSADQGASAKRVFLKVCRSDVDESMSQAFLAETAFYKRSTRSRRHPGVIHCHGTGAAPGGFLYLILEDLSETHYTPEWPLPPTTRECELAVECLGKLHARHWCANSLARNLSRRYPLARPSIKMIAKTASAFVKVVKGRISRRRLQCYRAAVDIFFIQWESRVKANPTTLLHGDAHFWNFLYPINSASADVRLCDWQFWRFGSPACDLAYLISLHHAEGERATAEERLIKLYHETILKHSVTGYTIEQIWHEYRLFVWYHLVRVAPFQWSISLPPSIWWPAFERSLAAFEQLCWSSGFVKNGKR